MAQDFPFNREDPFPSWFANRIQDFLSGAQTNLRLSLKDSDTVQVIPDPEMGLAAIAIQGRWRWRETTVQRDHPGGAKGTFIVWAVALENDIDDTPDPHTDHTDYSWDLRITSGADPSGAGVEIFEKIGEIDWSGSAIEALRQTHSSVTGAMLTDGALVSSSGDITWTRDPSGGLIANNKANSIGANELADDSVDTNALVLFAVTNAKIAGEAITEGKLGLNSVATNKIINLAVNSAKLAAKAVIESKLDDEAVSTLKLKELAVTTAKLALKAVETGQLGDLAVTAAKIAASAIEETKLADGAVTSRKFKPTIGELTGGGAAEFAEGLGSNEKVTDLAGTELVITPAVPSILIVRYGALISLDGDAITGVSVILNVDGEPADSAGLGTGSNLGTKGVHISANVSACKHVALSAAKHTIKLQGVKVGGPAAGVVSSGRLNYELVAS